MKSDCELVRKGEVKRRGITADRWVSSKGKVIYLCYGYFDSMTDEPLDECKRCKHWERNEKSLYRALFEDGESDG